MKIVVVVANGQLGTDLARSFRQNGDEVCELSHSDIEISSLDSVREVLGRAKPGLVVNAAAMHNVEACEKEPLRAYEVNALGSRNLALASLDVGAVLAHVSTDYVFDGLKRKPYLENDLATPLNVYGNTKLAGEEFIRASTDKYLILRTSALYGMSPCRAKGGRNFVELMLKLAGERSELKVVNDEFVSPTSTSALAKQIVAISRTDNYGLFHATAEGSCTWYEFAEKIFELVGIKTNLIIAGPNDFPAKVPRPKYSVLENYALKKSGLNSFENWEEGLREYLKQRRQSN